MIKQYYHGMIEEHATDVAINRSMRFLAYFPSRIEHDIMSQVDYLIKLFPVYNKAHYLNVRGNIFDILLSLGILQLGEEHVEKVKGSPPELANFHEPYEELLNEAIYLYLGAINLSDYNDNEDGLYDDICEEFYVGIGEAVSNIRTYLEYNCMEFISTLFDLPFFTTDKQGIHLQVMNLTLLERHDEFVLFEVFY